MMTKKEKVLRQIPNMLSTLRLLMVGAFIWLFVEEKYFIALGVYALAVFTDTLDGYLARRNNWITSLGKVLDPLADKLMLIAALGCFYFRGWIPLYLLMIVVGKELAMIIGGALLLKKKVVVYADWYGKIATLFFNAGVVATFCKNFWKWIGFWNIVLLGIAIVLAIIALVHYARKNVFVKAQPGDCLEGGEEREEAPGEK